MTETEARSGVTGASTAAEDGPRAEPPADAETSTSERTQSWVAVATESPIIVRRQQADQDEPPRASVSDPSPRAPVDERPGQVVSGPTAGPDSPADSLMTTTGPADAAPEAPTQAGPALDGSAAGDDGHTIGKIASGRAVPALGEEPTAVAPMPGGPPRSGAAASEEPAPPAPAAAAAADLPAAAVLPAAVAQAPASAPPPEAPRPGGGLSAAVPKLVSPTPAPPPALVSPTPVPPPARESQGVDPTTEPTQRTMPTAAAAAVPIVAGPGSGGAGTATDPYPGGTGPSALRYPTGSTAVVSPPPHPVVARASVSAASLTGAPPLIRPGASVPVGVTGTARVSDAVRTARATMAGATRGPRRARLHLKRIDPWSVMKFSFAVSLVLFVVAIVATSVLYLALDAMGVFGNVNNALSQMTPEGAAAAEPLKITAKGVIGTSVLLGAINMVLFTALMTLGAFVYNVCADLVGGIELTLSEKD